YFLLCVLVASVTADVSHISNEYLPPTYAAAASAPVQTYSAPVSAPSYTAPEQSFDVAAPSVLAEPEYAASEPVASHSFSSSDGYRYKTQRRVVYRHRQRRGAPSSEYLPPAASSPSVEYLSPDAFPAVSSYSASPSYQSETYAPAASYQSESYAEPSYAESAPAHSFSSNDGYRYKTARRRVYRRRRY
ncbi:DNA translocase FtsK-like, partial [Bactrocera neohumeralis]